MLLGSLEGQQRLEQASDSPHTTSKEKRRSGELIFQTSVNPAAKFKLNR
jgi:hypothetical protein